MGGVGELLNLLRAISGFYHYIKHTNPYCCQKLVFRPAGCKLPLTPMQHVHQIAVSLCDMKKDLETSEEWLSWKRCFECRVYGEKEEQADLTKSSKLEDEYPERTIPRNDAFEEFHTEMYNNYVEDISIGLGSNFGESEFEIEKTEVDTAMKLMASLNKRIDFNWIGDKLKTLFPSLQKMELGCDYYCGESLGYQHERHLVDFGCQRYPSVITISHSNLKELTLICHNNNQVIAERELKLDLPMLDTLDVTCHHQDFVSLSNPEFDWTEIERDIFGPSPDNNISNLAIKLESSAEILKTLSLENWNLKTSLSKFPKLKTLKLINCLLEEKKIAGHKFLEDVVISNLNNVKIIENLPVLRKLAFKVAERDTFGFYSDYERMNQWGRYDIEVDVLTNLPSLETLEMEDFCLMEGDSIPEFPNLKDLWNLKNIKISSHDGECVIEKMAEWKGLGKVETLEFYLHSLMLTPDCYFSLDCLKSSVRYISLVVSGRASMKSFYGGPGGLEASTLNLKDFICLEQFVCVNSCQILNIRNCPKLWFVRVVGGILKMSIREVDSLECLILNVWPCKTFQEIFDGMKFASKVEKLHFIGHSKKSPLVIDGSVWGNLRSLVVEKTQEIVIRSCNVKLMRFFAAEKVIFEKWSILENLEYLKFEDDVGEMSVMEKKGDDKNLKNLTLVVEDSIIRKSFIECFAGTKIGRMLIKNLPQFTDIEDEVVEKEIFPKVTELVLVQTKHHFLKARIEFLEKMSEDMKKISEEEFQKEEDYFGNELDWEQSVSKKGDTVKFGREVKRSKIYDLL